MLLSYHSQGQVVFASQISTFDGCSAHLRAKGATFENGGVWRCFAKAVEKRGIDVRFENPAVSLVQDPFTKEVSGVIARRADGTEYSMSATPKKVTHT